MIFILLGIVFAFFTSYTMFEPDDFVDWFMVCLFGSFLSLLTTLFFGVIACGIGSTADFRVYHSEKIELKALQDTSEISGRFYLGGGGSIQENPVYYYYTNQNGYRLKTVYANSAAIFEDEEESPYLIIDYYTFKNPFMWIVGIPVSSEKYPTYKFHIPKNSVTNSMDLDAKK